MASKILTTNQQLRVSLEKKLIPIIDKIQHKVGPQIELIVKRNLKQHFDNDDTISSLLGNKLGAKFSLQQEFGLTDSQALSAAVDIIDSIIDSVTINFSRGFQKETFVSGWVNYFIGRPPNAIADIQIIIAPNSFQEALAKRHYYISGDVQIPWLYWLLTEGGRIVVDGYSVGPSGSFASRAGGVLMRKKGVYRVDGLHAGTIGDNFITRGIESIIPQTLLEIQTLLSSS